MAILRGGNNFWTGRFPTPEKTFELNETTLLKLLELAYEDGWYGTFENKADNALQIVNSIKKVQSSLQEAIIKKYNKEKTDLYQ